MFEPGEPDLAADGWTGADQTRPVMRVATASLAPGTRLARPVFTSDGVYLFADGRELTTEHIRRLLEAGVPEVYVHASPRREERTIQKDEPISDETRWAAVNLLRRVFEQVEAAGAADEVELPHREIAAVVKEIQLDLAYHNSKVVNLVSHRSLEEYLKDHLVVHSLNTAVVSMALAKNYGLGLRVFDIGLGALLCDLGMALVPREVRRKPGSLTRQELELVRRHPVGTVRILEANQRFSPFAKAIALQHHERYDGSGYPQGLRGEEIHVSARLVALADVYTSLVSDRPHRRRLLPHEALDFLMAGAGFEFDYQLVQSFCATVVPYPVGTKVRLSTGEEGIVEEVGVIPLVRPVIRVVRDAYGRLPTSFYKLDLAAREHQTRFIVEVLDR